MGKTASLSADLVVTKGSATVAFEKGTAELKKPCTITFKITPEFRRRFRQRAFDADLKLCELIVETLDAWEEKHGLKKPASTKPATVKTASEKE